MAVLKVVPASSETALAQARRIIETGGAVAYPTETFYGIAVRYDVEKALRRLYELKQRPTDKAMPLIVGERRTLRLVALPLTSVARELTQMFWPGPLTILTPATKALLKFLTGGTGRVAVRIPGESFALRLARYLGMPITATSANISGQPPADTPGKVMEYFGENIDLLIDDGRTPGGKPSTIVDVTGEEVVVVREGAISRDEIFNALHRLPVSARDRQPQ